MKNLFVTLAGAFAHYQELSSLRIKKKMCWMAAEQICSVGFEEPSEVQNNLNIAKDHLYSAVLFYEKEIQRLTKP